MPEGDKTEKATGKRRNEARKKGQVAVSQDLNKAFQMMVSLVLFSAVGFTLFQQFSSTIRIFLGDPILMEMTDTAVLAAYKMVIFRVAEMLWPFWLAIVIGMVAINVIQVGFKVSPEVMRLNLSKMNPIKGFKKIFSLRSVVKLVTSLSKVMVLGLVVWWSLDGRMNEIGSLGQGNLYDILVYCFSLLLLILFRVGMVLLFLGLIDYFYQRWQYEKDMKMTKQEVKDEAKQTYGNPIIKNRIRKTQYEMARRRMIEDVPESTVVVTNPTHYAVAIKYDKGEMNAPEVVAKGMNLIAEKIKSVAREHHVPLVENRVLAQSLFRTVQIGEPIPPKLYRAVAEILTYVYKLKGKV